MGPKLPYEGRVSLVIIDSTLTKDVERVMAGDPSPALWLEPPRLWGSSRVISHSTVRVPYYGSLLLAALRSIIAAANFFCPGCPAIDNCSCPAWLQGRLRGCHARLSARLHNIRVAQTACFSRTAHWAPFKNALTRCSPSTKHCSCNDQAIF